MDAAGRDLRIGDWVRIASVPDSVTAMPRASRRAFSAAVGKTFQIEAFNRVGCAELDLSAKVGPDTIWIEPFCVVRTRRPKTRSARFSRVLAIQRKLKRPRWSFSYTVRYRARSPLRRLVQLNASLGFGHGWYVLANRKEIHGRFSTYDRKASSRRQLERLRLQLKKSGILGSLRVSQVRQAVRL